MRILGISAFYHDSAAALIEEGRIVAAAQEERFTRIKHDESFPLRAIEYCLSEAQCSLGSLDYIVFYDKPFLTFERLLATYLTFAPRGFSSFSHAMPIWLKKKLFLRREIRKQLKSYSKDFDWNRKLLFTEHHFSHAASAFYPSHFEEALILTMDGVGEWATTSLAIGKKSDLKIIQELHFPHSLGLLYSAFTYYLGFKVNSGEYKVMGLAPYGKPVYKDLIFRHLMTLKEDGSFFLNMKYFNYCAGLTMVKEKIFEKLLGFPLRKVSDPIQPMHMDLAASIQAVTNEVVLQMVRYLSHKFSVKNLCLAGGVALNCVTNGKILRENLFDHLWIQPAAGDAGGALGAALSAYYLYAKKPRVIKDNSDAMQGSYLGPEFSDEQIISCLREMSVDFEVVDEKILLDRVAKDLAAGKAIGWFQGRMEYGPRALGARSILADPRSKDMQSKLNLKIKFRESFRPFAPAVLEEDVAQWFDLKVKSPYMLLVAEIEKSHHHTLTELNASLVGLDQLKIIRSDIPAVTHVDYSARVQTVSQKTNPKFHALLTAFKHLTGCPVLVNTSFNVRGEPIVCTPEDAFRCFMRTHLDVLVIGNCYLVKKQQKSDFSVNFQEEFALD